MDLVLLLEGGLRFWVEGTDPVDFVSKEFNAVGGVLAGFKDIQDVTADAEFALTDHLRHLLITVLNERRLYDSIDMILKVGTDHHSLIGKFSITYIFEVLEALYHLKYGVKEKREL